VFSSNNAAGSTCPRLTTILNSAALFAALLVVFAIGCGKSESTIRDVSLPPLEGLPAPAREQIEFQYANTLASIGDIDDDSLGGHFGVLGQLLYTYDFVDAAEPAFQNAAELVDDGTKWNYYLGMLNRQRGDLEKAVGYYEEVLDENSKDALARLRLAEAFFELGRPEDAKEELEAVVDADPRQAFAFSLLGQMATDAQNYEAAIEHYERVLEIQPPATQIHTALAMAYRNLGNADQSRYHLERRGQRPVQLYDPLVRELEAYKETSGSNALTRGQELIDQGRYSDAVNVLSQSVQTDSTNASTYLSLGVAKFYAGDQEGAIREFEHTLRLDPTESKAYYNLAGIYRTNGDLEKSEQQYRAAIDSNPRHGHAHLELADILRRGGDCEAAIPHYEQSVVILPGNVDARLRLAICRTRMGDFQIARELLDEGLAANPGDVGFLDGMARILAASDDESVRDGDRALELAEKAIYSVSRVETIETVAMALAEVGRYEDAAKVQNEALYQTLSAGFQVYADHLRANLQRYQMGTPCRTPWPDFWYEAM